MYKTYFTCEITLHVAQMVNIEQLQQYISRSIVCFGYIILNTTHKADNKDIIIMIIIIKFSSTCVIIIIIIVKLYVIK